MAESIRSSKIGWFAHDISKVIILVWNTNPVYTLLVAVLTAVAGLIPVVHLWISKLLLDTVATILQGGVKDPDGGLARLLALVGIQAGMFFLTTLLSTVQNTARELLGEQVRIRIGVQVLEKTSRLELAFFEDEKFYNRLQNAYEEVGQRPLEIVSQFFFMAQSLVTLSSMAAILAQLHWMALPFIIFTTLPALWIQNRYGFQNYWMLRERAPELRKQHYYGMLLTSDWFIKEIRIFHLEKYLLDLYKTIFNKFFRQTRDLVLRRNGANILASGISILGWLSITAYVIFRSVARAITIGDFVLYTQAVSAVQGGLQSFFGNLSSLYSHTLFLRNLFDFLSLPARDLAAGKQWTEPVDEIEFREVSFRYPGSQNFALRDASFKVHKGQSLALVGKNGAGKTTIVKLLCRLYEPTCGEILVNGKNIAEYSPQSVQEQIAVLFQDYGNYYLSAAENIGVGKIDHRANRASIRIAAQKSGADRVIEDLPQQYETMLGKWFEDGAQLSGGEWQKVALARAFFRNGKMLILDEPTASLDAEAEYEVFENLVQNNGEQIKLLISHRFSTVRMADQILVLEDGCPIERGTHDELIEADGQYAYLFKLQARGYEL